MNCMKCGREIADGVFCGECLAEMDRYPIKPGTVVTLPVRKVVPKKVHSRRKTQLTPEEQLKRLRRLALRMLVVIVILTVLLMVTGYFAVIHLMESEVGFLPGQNYSAIVSDPLDQWD